jgi:hypothetical protein
MSSVNDALRRAKQAAPKNATPAVKPIQLAEKVNRSRGTGFLLGMLALVILMLAGLLLWQWSHGDDAQLLVRANSRPAAASVSKDAPIPAQPATTNVVSVAPHKSADITYKLQSIIYLPKNPSAVINGKVVFVNDSVNGARVVAISSGSATVVTSDGQTNVLVMH